MKKVLFGILICLLTTVGCNRPEPAPELRDPIYLDIQTRITSAEQALESEKALLMEARGMITEAVPQTNQMKWAQKRFYESTARMDKISQEIVYWKLKLSSRKQAAQKEYLKAWYKKEAWPNPKEFASWQQSMKINRNPGPWNIQKRFSELGVPYQNNRIPSSTQKAEKKAEPAPSGH